MEWAIATRNSIVGTPDWSAVQSSVRSDGVDTLWRVLEK